MRKENIGNVKNIPKDWTGITLNDVKVLTLHSIVKNKTNKGKIQNIYKWNAICLSCNKEFIVPSSYLNSNVKSCGCKLKEHKKEFGKKFAGANKLIDGEAGFNILYNEYVRSADRRNFKFSITLEKFRELTKLTCHYCGEAPCKISYDSISKKTTGYIFNGLDRKDSKIGYIEENVLPCCSICNYAKRSMSYTDYINHVKKSAIHLIKNDKL